MKKVYCYDHKPVTEIVETDSDSDGFHIEITESALWRKVKTAREKTQKKTTFGNDSDDAIQESVSTLNKIVSYHDTDTESQQFVV